MTTAVMLGRRVRRFDFVGVRVYGRDDLPGTLARGRDLIIASAAQASDPRAGLWMRPLAYQTDAKASATSRDAFVFTVVL